MSSREGIPIDATSTFNVYKVTYVCTSRYESDKPVGVRDHCYLITGTEEGVEFWFREEFNCHGDIYDLLQVEKVIDHPAHFDFMHYIYIKEVK